MPKKTTVGARVGAFATRGLAGEGARVSYTLHELYEQHSAFRVRGPSLERGKWRCLYVPWYNMIFVISAARAAIRAPDRCFALALAQIM